MRLTSGHMPKVSLRHVFFSNRQILGETTGSKASLFRIVQFAHEGKLAPVLDRVLPVKDARHAQELLERRQHFGKLVLVHE